MTIKKWILSLVLVIAGGSSVTGVLFGSSGSLSVAMVRPPATSTTTLWSYDWKKTCAIGMVAVTGVGILGRMFISWNNLQRLPYFCKKYQEPSFFGALDPLTLFLYKRVTSQGKGIRAFELKARQDDNFKNLKDALHQYGLSDRINLDVTWEGVCASLELYCGEHYKALSAKEQKIFIKNELKTPRLYKPGDERSSIK
ncbi:MAG: hypothetical protein WBQ73_01745 [Candidatus Babeliales bacterium]